MMDKPQAQPQPKSERGFFICPDCGRRWSQPRWWPCRATFARSIRKAECCGREAYPARNVAATLAMGCVIAAAADLRCTRCAIGLWGPNAWR